MITRPGMRILDPTLTLADENGEPVRLADVHTQRFLVLHLVRYFGCLPCQDWLIELDSRSGELAQRGASVAAVGGSADYQARWLRNDRGVAMPLLLDPQHRVRESLALAAPLGWRLLDPRGLAAYARSVARGARPQRITRDTVRHPGVVILGPSLEVVWAHVGERIGDYPEHSRVLAALDAVQ